MGMRLLSLSMTGEAYSNESSLRQMLIAYAPPSFPEVVQSEKKLSTTVPLNPPSIVGD